MAILHSRSFWYSRTCSAGNFLSSVFSRISKIWNMLHHEGEFRIKSFGRVQKTFFNKVMKTFKFSSDYHMPIFQTEAIILKIPSTALFRGKNWVLLNSVQYFLKLKLSASDFFYIFALSIRFYKIPLPHIKECRCLRKAIHQIDKK